MLKKYIIFLFLCVTFNFITVSALQTQEYLKNSKYHFLDTQSDSLSIYDVIKLYKNDRFNIPITKIFNDFHDKESSWLCLNLESSNIDRYLSFWCTYLNDYDLYIIDKDSINSEINENKINSINPDIEFRLPTWKINKSSTEKLLFIRIKSTLRYNSVKYFLHDDDKFIEFIKVDSYIISSYLVFTFVLILLITLLFFAKQQKSAMVWYFFFIVMSIVEFLIFKGIFIKRLISFSEYLLENNRTLVYALLLFSYCMFFYHLYTSNYKKSVKFFKYLAFVNFGLIISFFLQYLINSNHYMFVLWYIMRIEILVIVIVHVQLVYKKILPWYMVFVFSLTMLSYMILLFKDPNISMSVYNTLLYTNLPFIALLIELALITYFIFDKIIQENKMISLIKKENLQLQNSFQKNILQLEYKERTKLLRNVHDTFGGYIEALKLRLLHQSNSSSNKIKEILDAFYKDYRFLINTLYSPKINSSNFVESVKDFCAKLNEVSKCNISYDITLRDIKLDQEQCFNLYFIISESITNAIKYSKANWVRVSLKHENKHIYCIIKDDGIGFELIKIKKNSFGLANIKGRVEQMNGEIEIKSIISKGTSIDILIPIKNE